MSQRNPGKKPPYARITRWEDESAPFEIDHEHSDHTMEDIDAPARDFDGCKDHHTASPSLQDPFAEPTERLEETQQGRTHPRSPTDRPPVNGRPFGPNSTIPRWIPSGAFDHGPRAPNHSPDSS